MGGGDQSSSGSTNTQLFVAGAVGGVAECLAVQPFDMLKTRFQLSTVPNPSVWSSLKAVVAEGGFMRLYRGILPEAGPCPRSAGCQRLRVAVYGQLCGAVWAPGTVVVANDTRAWRCDVRCVRAACF